MSVLMADRWCSSLVWGVSHRAATGRQPTRHIDRTVYDSLRQLAAAVCRYPLAADPTGTRDSAEECAGDDDHEEPTQT
jgi:hypothetical protein